MAVIKVIRRAADFLEERPTWITKDTTTDMVMTEIGIPMRNGGS
jgi:hypothetical protein